jgi:hypothetical protein
MFSIRIQVVRVMNEDLAGCKIVMLATKPIPLIRGDGRRKLLNCQWGARVVPVVSHPARLIVPYHPDRNEASFRARCSVWGMVADRHASGNLRG